MGIARKNEWITLQTRSIRSCAANLVETLIQHNRASKLRRHNAPARPVGTGSAYYIRDSL